MNVPEEDRPNPGILWDTTKCVIRGCTIEYLAKKKQNYAKSRKDVNHLHDLYERHDLLADSEVDTWEVVRQINEQQEVVDNLIEVDHLHHKQRNWRRHDAFSDTCSKYFFSKVKGIPGSLRYIFKSNGELGYTDEEILFMLLPSPTKEGMKTLDKVYFAHIWNGPHRIKKEIMFQPKNKGDSI